MKDRHTVKNIGKYVTDQFFNGEIGMVYCLTKKEAETMARK